MASGSFDSNVSTTPACLGTHTNNGVAVEGTTNGTTGGAGVAGYSTAATGGVAGGYFTCVSTAADALVASPNTTSNHCRSAITGKNYSGGTMAVYGWFSATNGIGVQGECTGTGTQSIGVYGLGGYYGVKGYCNVSGQGAGVYGNGWWGVWGDAAQSGGYGVRATNSYAASYAVMAAGALSGGYGLGATGGAIGAYCTATASSGANFGVRADCSSNTSGSAGVYATGNHTGVYGAGPVNGVYGIGSGTAGGEVDWCVTAHRADPWYKANRPGVEVHKAKDAGKYLHPEVHGCAAYLAMHTPLPVPAARAALEPCVADSTPGE